MKYEATVVRVEEQSVVFTYFGRFGPTSGRVFKQHCDGGLPAKGEVGLIEYVMYPGNHPTSHYRWEKKP